MAEIKLTNLAHDYGDGSYALRDIDLRWEDGGAYALLGPSGCGKTTMLNIISGLVRPSEGQVIFDGLDVSSVSTVDRNIAQVFQFPVLYESMTVEANLRFPLRNRGVSRADAQRRAEEVAEMLEISDLLKRRAKGLSADAKQLVSLGRALVRPDVSAILFDEPLTVIDPLRKAGIRQVLKRIHQEFNHTLVYVTHDQTEALTFADEVVVMSDGAVVQQATPTELFEHPAHRFVGNFIGSPGMNFLPVSVLEDNVMIEGVAVLKLPSEQIDFAAASEQGQLEVGIRSEFVTCFETEGPSRVRAVVERRHDLGTKQQIDLLVGDAHIVAKPPAGSPAVPDQCWVGFRTDMMSLFHRDQSVEGITPIPVSKGSTS